MNTLYDPAAWWRDTDSMEFDLRKAAAELDLYEFLKQAWSSFDPAPFVDTFVLQAVAEHLEAIATGSISRLIINVPPRTSKTSMTNVAFPAWVWAQPESRWSHWMGPKVQFLTASYSSNLILRDANRCRRLIQSQWYQNNWGDRVQLVKDQNAKGRFDNTHGGTRFSTSVGATLTGEGGNIIILDDPNNAQDANSDVILESTRDWFDQALSTRFNNPSKGALIVIQQRFNEGDITGHILSKDQGDYVHLMLPMRYEKDRAAMIYPNEVGFTDWRSEEGELLTPERMDEKAVSRLEKTLGPYGAAGQLQQRPSPKGGGIIKREFWREYTDSDYPVPELVVASLDTAFTEDRENDPSACTIWMPYKGDGMGQRCLLAYAWAEHLAFNDLLDKTVKDCRRYHVNVLLIENKASGPVAGAGDQAALRPSRTSSST
jgi:hypothetical protein